MTSSAVQAEAAARRIFVSLDDDTQAETFERYRRKRGLSRASAARMLLYEALERERRAETEAVPEAASR